MVSKKLIKHLGWITYNCTKYYEIFYKILKVDSDEKAINELRNYEMSELEYFEKLEIFKEEFPVYYEEAKYLENIYLQYKKTCKLEKDEKLLSTYLDMLKTIFENHYSIEEYCLIYSEYTVDEVNEIADKIKFIYPDIYNEFINCTTVSNEEFYSSIKNIVSMIKQNDNFDIFDYYYYIKLDISNFIKICKKILTKEEFKVIDSKLSKLKDKSKKKINKDFEINREISYGSKVVTTLEKEKIFTFLDENNIPYSAYLYALRKYVNGDERLVAYVKPKEKVNSDNHIANNEFLKRIDYYDKKASAPCQYIQLFYELLSCENEEQALFKLRRIRIDKSTYNFKLDRFNNMFELKENELEFLKNIYSKYETYFKINKVKQSEDLDVYVKILTDIINSGYSMYEYCSKYGGFTINEIKMMHKHVYKNYPDIYEEFSKKCMNLSIDFYYSILEVVEQMICCDNFDLFDYYYYTKLSPRDFLEICKKMLRENMLYIVHPIARKFERQSKLFTNIQSEINGKTIIGGRVIQPEEKFKIAEYLDEHYMPNCAYKYALRKYVAGDERLTEYVNPNQKVIK